LRHAGGETRAIARPEDVPPDQLDALRRHRAEIEPLIKAYGEAWVLIRPKAEPPEVLAERMHRVARSRKRKR
jgi:hypothetical protein